jgi:hypothetical protein
MSPNLKSLVRCFDQKGYVRCHMGQNILLTDVTSHMALLVKTSHRTRTFYLTWHLTWPFWSKQAMWDVTSVKIRVNYCHLTPGLCERLSLASWVHVRCCHLPHGFMRDVVTWLKGHVATSHMTLESSDKISHDPWVKRQHLTWTLSQKTCHMTLESHVGYCHLTQGSCEMLPFDSKVVWDVATLLNGHVKCCHYKVKFSSSWYTFIWFIIFFTLNW